MGRRRAPGRSTQKRAGSSRRAFDKVERGPPTRAASAGRGKLYIPRHIKKLNLIALRGLNRTDLGSQPE